MSNEYIETFARDIAVELAPTLDAQQLDLLRQLISALAQDAEAEGAGCGIWTVTWHIIGLLEQGAADTPPPGPR